MSQPTANNPRNSPIGTKEKGELHKELANYDIDQYCNQLGVSASISQVGKALYRRSLEKPFIQYRTLNELCAASVQAACRTQNAPVSSKEIATVSGVNLSRLNQTFSDIVDHLNIQAGPIDPKSYVPKYCRKLGLDDEPEQVAISIIEECEDSNLKSGRSPSAYAAAAVYAACLLSNSRKTQREVADVSQCSVKTVSQTYQAQILTVVDDQDNLSEFMSGSDR